MRKQVSIIVCVASAILLNAVMQDVLAPETLLDDSFSQSRQWLFSFNKGDKLTGVLSCTDGIINLLVWLYDGGPMLRQRAMVGQSFPISWVIPSAGSWNVEIMYEQYPSSGHIKLDVERATGTGILGFVLDPIGRIILIGIVATIAIVVICVLAIRYSSGTQRAKKNQTLKIDFVLLSTPKKYRGIRH